MIQSPSVLIRLLAFSAAIAFPPRIQSQDAIEFVFLSRYDNHANYSSNFAGRAYNDYYRLYGLNYGIGCNYRRFVAKRIIGYAGLGYYQLNVHKIRGPMPFGSPGERSARDIRFEDGITNLGYGTTRYRYNNIAGNIGALYYLPVTSSLAVEAGPELLAYYSFSQRYRLGDATRYAPEYWRTNQSKGVEYGINVNVGVHRAFSRFYIRPAVIIPVYQNLKGDVAFFEERSMNISSWFTGVGFKLAVGKELR